MHSDSIRLPLTITEMEGIFELTVSNAMSVGTVIKPGRTVRPVIVYKAPPDVHESVANRT